MAQPINPLIRKILVSLVVLSVSLAGLEHSKYYSGSTVLAQARDWEPSIRKFEEQDKVNPPKLGSIVFTGSSSIARWETLAEEMKPLDVINRGFGGSQYSDLNLYAKRIVIAYHPRAVVIYEGDNDLAPESSKIARIGCQGRPDTRPNHSRCVTGNLDLPDFHQTIEVEIERMAQNEGSEPDDSRFHAHAGMRAVH